MNNKKGSTSLRAKRSSEAIQICVLCFSGLTPLSSAALRLVGYADPAGFVAALLAMTNTHKNLISTLFQQQNSKLLTSAYL
jgi:hypothetical protein